MKLIKYDKTEDTSQDQIGYTTSPLATVLDGVKENCFVFDNDKLIIFQIIYYIETKIYLSNIVGEITIIHFFI